MRTQAKSMRSAMRRKAHEQFDRLWLGDRRGRRVRRALAYRWLAKQFGMSVDDCHIASFDVGMCEAVIELCEQVVSGELKGPRFSRPKRKWKKLEDKIRRRLRRQQVEI